MKKRVVAFMLALTLFLFTPVSDYFGAKNVYAVGTLTASEYVWSVLFSSLGVAFADDQLRYVIADMGDYFQGTDNPYWKTFKAVGNATWGSVLDLGSSALSSVKNYLKSKEGYGSDTGLDALTINSIRSPDSYIVFNGEMTVRGSSVFNYKVSHTAPVFIIPVKWNSEVGAKYNCGFVALSSEPFEPNMGDKSKEADGVYYSYASYHILLDSGEELPESGYTYTFHNYIDCMHWFTSLDSSYLGNPSIAVSVDSVPDIQQRIVDSPVVITIPSETVARNIIDVVYGTDTAPSRADALAPTMDVIYGDKVDTDEDEGTYPWLPDITNVLNGIKDRVAGVSDDVKSLSDSIAGVEDKVDAIPNTIATDIATTDVSAAKSFTVADLGNIFPFCLPFDLIDFFAVLSAEPQAPKINWTFPAVPLFSVPEVEIVIDLSVFDTVASLVRTLETLLFIVGLAMITRSHMIRG